MSALAAFETQRARRDALHAFNAHTHIYKHSSARQGVAAFVQIPARVSFGRGGGGVSRAAGGGTIPSPLAPVAATRGHSWGENSRAHWNGNGGHHAFLAGRLAAI